MNSSGSTGLTPVQWLVCVIASIGFAFDIYEIVMLPLILGPAITELTGYLPGTPDYASCVSQLFYVPALAGGFFGLLGGYFTDRFGRRRVLTWSILLYAFSAFAAGFSTNFNMLLFFRTTTFIGVCVEFPAAVAWLAELFSEPKQREKVLGYTQAFSSIGGLLVAYVNAAIVAGAAGYPSILLPDWLNLFGGSIKDPHAAWRYTLMSGLIPAIPLILIRPFLPESPVWARKKAEGTLKRPSFLELFSPQLRKVTIISTLMVALSYGAAFGAIQHLPRIVGGLPEVKEMTAGKKVPEQKKIEQGVAAGVTKVQEIGGLTGRFVLAIIVVYIASRRTLIRIFQVPGIIIVPVVFAIFATQNLTWLKFGIFLVGFLAVAQFSFWGNYLPRVYPAHLRGTGESFAANIGGRMIGTLFAAVTAQMAASAFIPGGSPFEKLAYSAAIIGCFVFLAGFVLSFLLPEPAHEELPE